MKLLPLFTVTCVLLVILGDLGQAHTPLSIGRQIGRFIRRPFRTLSRIPLAMAARMHTAKKLIASKLALALLVKKALIAKPLLVLKTITGAKLIASSFAGRGASASRELNLTQVNIPLQLRVNPITIKSYIHTKGTLFDSNNRRERDSSGPLISSKSINQNTNRSTQQQQLQLQQQQVQPLQQLPRVTLV